MMNFLLFSDDPIYKFFRWVGLGARPSNLFKRRILFFCLFTWLPLLILSLIGQVKLSLFISDIDVHVRFLISLALLLYAEVIANERFQLVVKQFINCDIIADKDRKKYTAFILSADKLSSSLFVDIILLIFVFTVGHWLSSRVLSFDISTWYFTQINNKVSLSLPGYWYAFVSLPIFQFFLLRWYYRIGIWYRFLWKVSQLKLQLNALHPDKAGGIAFLMNSVYGLEPFLLAHSFLLAGIILNALLNSDLSLWFFRFQILDWMLALVLIPLIPMVFFMRQLTATKRNGLNEFEVFANQYVNEFKKKWMNPEVKNKEKLLGTSDLQSLADLSNSFNVSEHMNILPLTKNAILFLVIFTALPFLPLIFFVIPLDKILMQMLSVVF